jgi:uncharacterized MAPEG superfamily protein
MTSIPILCLPIAVALIYLPKIPLSMAMAKQPEGYDNKHPRDQQAKLTGWGRRAAAAHANGFESFAVFAAGVLAAEVTGANQHLASIFAIGYVIARFVYTFVYLANVGLLRTLVWSTGFAFSIALMVLPIVG